MKRMYIFCILFLLFNCKKIFKEDIQNSFSLKTTDDYNVAMTGLYNRLFNGVMASPLFYIYSIGNEDDLGVFNGSINFEPDSPCIACIYNLNNYIYVYSGCGISVYEPENHDFTEPYKYLFQAIACANNILSKAGDIGKLPEVYKNYIGEVYFIRAYCYFRLVRNYGQIPIVDNPDVNYTLKKPSFSEIYNFIISDLQKAYNLLPNSNSEARIKYVTPHRGSAKALLAEVYLTMGGYPVYDAKKYNDAAKIAGEVIDSAAYFGFGLMPDLADLWNGNNVMNSETVFSFYFLPTSKNVGGGAYNSDENFFTNQYGWNQWIGYRVPADFYNSFPKSYRKEATFQTRGFKHWPFDMTIAHLDSITYCRMMFYKKFYTQFYMNDDELRLLSSGTLPSYNGHIVYLLRYVQTLLTFAEAKARSGVVDKTAYDAVNQVRRRANKADLFSPSPYDLTPGLTPQQFADSVVQERAWELCAEPEGRWYDIVRLNLVKSLPKIKQKQGIIVYPIIIDTTTYFIPIPKLDKTVNPNLE